MDGIYDDDKIIDIEESDRVTVEPVKGGLCLAAEIDNLADGITLRMQEDPSQQELEDDGTSVDKPDAGWEVKFPKLGITLGVSGALLTVAIILVVIFVVV